VIVNKAGIGDRGVYAYCESEGLPILLEIPHDKRIAACYSEGIPFIKRLPEWQDRFAALMKRVAEEQEKKREQ
jgi:MinD superfamily P-loop ATPase